MIFEIEENYINVLGVGSGHRVRQERDELHYVECCSSLGIASEDPRGQCH